MTDNVLQEPGNKVSMLATGMLIGWAASHIGGMLCLVAFGAAIVLAVYPFIVVKGADESQH